MFLSFIIPVYNCEKLIFRCVKSIESQSCRDYEIILINDGSKDDSLVSCTVLAEKYNNITVIDQNNKGASSARNAGLAIAKGDYVWFVDADDFISEGIVLRLQELSEANADDVFAMNYKHIINGKYTDIIQYNADRLVSIVEFLDNNPCMFAATKVYKKTALKGVTFCDGLTNIEDFLFNIQVLAGVDNIHEIHEVGYVYDNTNQQSTSRKRDEKHLDRLSNDSLIVHQIINSQIKAMDCSELKDVIRRQLNYSIVGHLYSLLRFYDIKRIKDVVNWYVNNNLYPVGPTGKKRADIARLLLFNNYRLFLAYSYLSMLFRSR